MHLYTHCVLAGEECDSIADLQELLTKWEHAMEAGIQELPLHEAAQPCYSQSCCSQSCEDRLVFQGKQLQDGCSGGVHLLHLTLMSDTLI